MTWYGCWVGLANYRIHASGFRSRTGWQRCAAKPMEAVAARSISFVGEKLPTGLDFIIIPRDAAKPELQPLMKSLIDLSWRLQKRLKRDESAARRLEEEEKAHAKAQRRKEADE